MRIASVTVTYNDQYKIKEWLSYYHEYRSEISVHIIVDNGSDPDFSRALHDLFPGSVIIRRDTNKGTTAAYNDGIRYALEQADVDSILLLGNDIRMRSGNLTILHEALFREGRCGVIMPLLFAKDSDVIESYGSTIDSLLSLSHAYENKRVDDRLPLIHEVGGVAGGINLAKREYYESLGLQDEGLFMYGDEIDMGLRMAAAGVKAMATRRAVAWHQHISPTGSKCRQEYAVFLIRRNNIYLAYKHFGPLRAIAVFAALILRAPLLAGAFIRKGAPGQLFYYLFGCICGICRIQRNFRFIVDN